MATPRIPNYLRAHRKRLGLSQDDVAFLLGSATGAKMCRYESFNRVPTLQAALALEVVLGRPVSELFRGIFQTVEIEVRGRAKKRADALVSAAPKAQPRTKVLREIANSETKQRPKGK